MSHLARKLKRVESPKTWLLNISPSTLPSRRICGQIAAVCGDFRDAKHGEKPSPGAGPHLADGMVEIVQDGEDRIACGAFQKQRDRRPSAFTSPIPHVVAQGGVGRGFAGIEALGSAIRMPLHSGGKMVEIPLRVAELPLISREIVLRSAPMKRRRAQLCVWHPA